LLAGEHPTDRKGENATTQKMQKYLECGLTYFVDLTRAGEKSDYESILRTEAREKGIDNVGYVRLPIRDFGIPDHGRMESILNAIDRAITDNHKVYVHCRGGIGRTGTTVGCYLVRHGYPGPDALAEVNRLFQSSDRSMESAYSPETRDQMEFVTNWNDLPSIE
jgi:protein-tyrosine phosphatase